MQYPYLNPKTVFDVVPNDTNDLVEVSVIYIGTGGDIKVEASGGGTVTFKNYPDGTFLPIRVKKVYSTDTNASDMIGAY